MGELKDDTLSQTNAEAALELTSIGNLDGMEHEIAEKAPQDRLTLKHAIVLFSLTLLWLSAAGPVFFITASIGISLRFGIPSY